jgi:cell wall-associated NlpC family hydrolase
LRRLSVLLATLLAVSLASPAGQPSAAAETPVQKIRRLRAEASKVRAAIDRMNDQVGALVEDYNANEVELGRTMAAQRETAQRQRAAEAQLVRAQATLDGRVRSIYIAGPVTGVEQMLLVRDFHEAMVATRYQSGVVVADKQAVAKVTQAKALLAAIAADLARQRRASERLRARLAAQRRAIEGKLAEQRAYLARIKTAVKVAVEQERRRQEELRRRALARRLAAERAARARAAARARHRHSRTAFPSHLPRPGRAAARQAIAFARAQLGKPYLWGGTGPDRYDCSGLTMMAYRSAGIVLPRTSRQQWYAGPHVPSMFDLAPGDLVFFANDLDEPSTIHHMGMVIGNGLMIEAPYTGSVVRVRSINRPDYIGAVRPSA